MWKGLFRSKSPSSSVRKISQDFLRSSWESVELLGIQEKIQLSVFYSVLPTSTNVSVSAPAPLQRSNVWFPLSGFASFKSRRLCSLDCSPLAVSSSARCYDTLSFKRWPWPWIFHSLILLLLLLLSLHNTRCLTNSDLKSGQTQRNTVGFGAK